MSHVRQLIRSNIVSTLTGLTTTGSRVYQSRFYPIESGKMPGLAVYTKTESVDYQTISPPRKQIRTLDVGVEIYTTGQNLDNALDNIAIQVEEALTADITRGGYAKDTKIASFEADFNGDGEVPLGVGRFSVIITYSTQENDVETSV